MGMTPQIAIAVAQSISCISARSMEWLPRVVSASLRDGSSFVRITSLAAVLLSLTSCQTRPVIRDSLINHEVPQYSDAQLRAGYRMRDLVCALPFSWEIGPADRGQFISSHFPDDLPEDYVILPASGAQNELQCLRVAPDVVAVVMKKVEVPGEPPDGFFVVKRVRGGWIEITDQTLSAALPRGASLNLFANGCLSVTAASGPAETVWFRLAGGKFLKL